MTDRTLEQLEREYREKQGWRYRADCWISCRNRRVTECFMMGTKKSNSHSTFERERMNIDRTKLRELNKAATPGTWTLIHVQNVTTGKSDIAISDRDVPVGEKPTRLICSITPVELQDEADWINAELIIEARNSIIPLLDALEAAEQRVAELEAKSRMQIHEPDSFDDDCPY
ncbi:MAG: ead/Ea22-like family protein [Patescibacteria group bacterium]|nr:ead/Ea22-like family protein [Patescibacteria group bacterium]